MICLCLCEGGWLAGVVWWFGCVVCDWFGCFDVLLVGGFVIGVGFCGGLRVCGGVVGLF